MWIDLLRIYINQFHPEQNTAIGLELKVLPRKYGDRWHVNLGPFYQGLGQVLTYFEHGVDRAALVVGFHKNCTDHPNETKDAESLPKPSIYSVTITSEKSLRELLPNWRMKGRSPSASFIFSMVYGLSEM